ncbi:MAG: rod shape-determining protein MreC [Methylophilales bacterium]|nr:rod shape-determining protein MreC [Methylophilales bacterium]
MIRRVTVQQHPPQAFFVRGPSPFARLIFFSALSIVLMAVDSRLHYLNEVRQGFATLLYPLELVASAPVRIYRHVNSYFVDQKTLTQENARLTTFAMNQALDLQRLTNTEAENAHLRSLFEARQKLKPSTELAEILHTGRDPFVHKVEVNIGTQQGVAPGQAVVDGFGVIGQVTRVYPFTSEVTLITDKSLVIPVQVARNGLRAIAFGHGRDNTLYVPYLPTSVDIKEGDKLMTSGIDNTYPEGLTVAVVTRIERDPNSPFAHIICTPAAGTDRRRQVLIITGSLITPPSPITKKASHAPRQ